MVIVSSNGCIYPALCILATVQIMFMRIISFIVYDGCKSDEKITTLSIQTSVRIGKRTIVMRKGSPIEMLYYI